MILHDFISGAWPAVLPTAIAGFVLGAAYFASLRRGVQVSIARRAWLPYMTRAPARLAAAALFLTFVARCGLPPLLAAFAGFVAARTLALRGPRRLA